MKFFSKLRKASAMAMSGMLALGLAFSMAKAPVKADDELNMNLSLNIYSIGGGSEKGQAVTVTGEGQYEVSFDCATDLSESAKDAGVTAIADFGAIYITDDDALTVGQSPVSSCKIMYDAVIVDGVELTVTQTEPKEAVKSNGVFDTGDPLNAWEGNVVEEAVIDSNAFTVNFTTVENPQKITIKFTLSDMVMAEASGDTPEETTPAPTLPEPGDFDPSSNEYIAQMYIQVGGSWVFRDPYSNASTGAIGGYQYADQLSDVQDAANPVPHDGKFTDVVLKGNGTYTLTLENPDFTNGGGTEATNFNLIGISTNIPYSAAETVKVTDMTIKVNDSSMLKYTFSEAVFDPDGEKGGYINVLGVNIWNKEDCVDCNEALGTTSSWPPSGKVDKVVITFTISGFDHDAAAEGGDETEASTTAAASNDETQAATTAAASNSNNNADKDDDNKGGLPTGAIIGIVAAVVVIIAVIIGVAVSKSKKK